MKSKSVLGSIACFGESCPSCLLPASQLQLKQQRPR